MGIKNAVVKRFRDIMNERGITPNALAVMSGVTPSTVYSMLDENRKDLSILTIKKLCDGLDISIADFFNTSEFKSLEQEII